MNIKTICKKAAYAIVYPIANILLFICGWELPNRETINFLKQYDRLVFLFPHTSYWDFWLAICYFLATSDIPTDDIVTVMKPQPFNTWYGFFPRLLGFIPATKLEDKGSGFVDTTVARLKNQNRSYVFISPEGKMNRSPWRSGYYYLARGLECNCLVIGLDYSTRTIHFGQLRNSLEYEYTTFESILQHDIAQIVPLHPECSWVMTKTVDRYIMPISLELFVTWTLPIFFNTKIS